MKVATAPRARHLVLALERGDELPDALLAGLEAADVRSGHLSGTGLLEAAELAVLDADGKSYHRARRLDAAVQVVSLSGTIAEQAGSAVVRLSATLAREADVGLVVAAGVLLHARVIAFEVFVTALDAVPLARSPDDPAALVLAMPEAAPAVALARPSKAPEREAHAGPALPARPVARSSEPEAYPEAGDAANHFHFGECTVVSSDGDRIRLRQDRDGRLREVSLTMLRVEPPTVDAEGHRHFRLSRKQ